MKKISALFATLFAATSLCAADIWEIRPCDAYGNSLVTGDLENKPMATLAAPLGGGEDIYFNIRLVERQEAAPLQKQGGFFLQHMNPLVDPETEWQVSPLQIGIFVGGRPEQATLCNMRRTPSEIDFTGTKENIDPAEYLWDVVFHYKTKAGDSGLPIRLALANGKPVPENYDAEGSLTPPTQEYLFHNTDKWRVQYHSPDGTITNNASFLFAASAPVPVDTPEKDRLGGNYSLKDCGFYVKTVDFKGIDPTQEYWKTVPRGHNQAGSLATLGGAIVTDAATFYVWVADPEWLAAAKAGTSTDWIEPSVGLPTMTGVTTRNITVGYDKVTGKAIPHSVKVAEVKIVGGAAQGDFTFTGLTAEKPAVLIASTSTDFVWKTGTGYTLIEDFLSANVYCEESVPEARLKLTEEKNLYTVTSDYQKRVTTLSFELTDAYAASDVKVTITPKLTVPDKYVADDIVRLALEDDPLSSWEKLSPLEFTIRAGQTDKRDVYVYGMGCGNKNLYTAGLGYKIEFDVKVDPAAAIQQTNVDALYFQADPPAFANKDDLAWKKARGGVALPVDIAVSDNFTDMNDTNTGFVVKFIAPGLGDDEEKAVELKDKDGNTCKWKPQPGDHFLMALDGEGKLTETRPAIPGTVSTGDATLWLVAPNGVKSEKFTMHLEVTDPCKVWATAYATEEAAEETKTFEEYDAATGESATAYVEFTLSEPYLNTTPDDCLYAYLAPADEATLTNAEGICLTNAESSAGIAIPRGEVTSTGRGMVTFKDGKKPYTTYKFDIVLCTSSSYDATKIVKDYTRKNYLQPIVKNSVPMLHDVNMNGWTLEKHDDGSLWMNGSVARGVPQPITFTVWDAEGDLKATGTDAFKLEYQFIDGGKSGKKKSLTGDPADMALTNSFANVGTAKMNVWLTDKDGGTTVSPYVINILVTDKPRVEITCDMGNTFYETSSTEFKVALSENTADENLTVELSVDAMSAGDKAGEMLVEGDCTPKAGVGNVYTFIFKPGETEHYFHISSADGTGLDAGAQSKFSLTGAVTTESFVPDQDVAWKDYYDPGRFSPVTIVDVVPSIRVDGRVCTQDADLNSSNSPIVVAIGEANEILWSVSDVTRDLAAGISVTIVDHAGPHVFTATTTENHTFKPEFKYAGPTTITLTATDKDGGPITVTRYYLVKATRMLTTTAVGPGSKQSIRSGKYGSAGSGHTWANGVNAGASYFTLEWNCGLANAVLAKAQGYRVGQKADGSLFGGTDIKLDSSGNKTTGPTYYVYQPADWKDSFFYCWVNASADEDGRRTGEIYGPVDPEITMLRQTSIDLPTEADEDGNYKQTVFEAVFAKEYLRTDNIGDINQDGIPDIYVKAYRFDVFDENGDLTGDDTTTLNNLHKNEQTNADGDYFPFIFGDLQAAFRPGSVSNWVDEARAFTTKLEIRGWGDPLNNAYQVLSERGFAVNLPAYEAERRYEDPKLNTTNSTLTELEWDAYVLAGKPGVDKWSPERPTDPTTPDTDDDGLPDGYEYYIWYKAHVGYMDNGVHRFLTGRRYNPTNPYEPTIIKSEDLANMFDPLTPSDSDWDTTDTDWDGLTDSAEFALGTNPFDFDSDGDGLPDGYEVAITGTDPLKYATNDIDPDGTLNSDNDSMAVYDEPMDIIGVRSGEGTKYYCCPLSTNFTVSTAAEAKPCTLLKVYVAEGSDTNFYFTTAKVTTFTNDVDGKIYLVGDLEKATTYTGRYDDEGKLHPGAPTRLVRGTVLNDISDSEYYAETVAEVPGKSWVAFPYNGGYARGRSAACGIGQEVTAHFTDNVKVMHYHVFQTHPYDPRTGWFHTTGCIETAPYTHMDEFLSMQFFYNAGTLSAEDMTPTVQKPMTAIWAKYSTSPVSFDTDQDKMPDGWEFYVMAKNGEGAPGDKYSPLSKFQLLTDPADRDNDNDELEWPEEYSGTSSSARYGWSPTYPQWRNKSMPTNPWNNDTDGDGVLDGYEGGIYPPDAPWWEAVIVAQNFMYNTSGKAGGGLDPLSWDTDMDGLPDPWEIEFHGTYTAGGTTTVSYNFFDDGSKSETIAAGASTTSVTRVVGVGATWNMDGMDGTVPDARLDYDSDGLANWQEYMAGTMRCWRYDDTCSSWGMHHENKPKRGALADGKVPDPSDTQAWGQWWYDRLVDVFNQNGNYNPNLANGYFDPGSVYFSCCTNVFDAAKGRFYYFRDGVYHDLKKPVWGVYSRFVDPLAREYMVTGELPTYDFALYPRQYICCDPRNHDTDYDGMDDYYELFHGMNPLLGTPAVSSAHLEGVDRPYDVIYDAYGRSPASSIAFSGDGAAYPPSALNNWWRNAVTNHVPASIKHASVGGYDFVAHPWLNGAANADPDGDNIANQEESIMQGVQAASTYHHSDPTPLWMTDTSYTNSLTRRYYKLETGSWDEDCSGWTLTDMTDDTFVHEGVTYHFSDFPGFKYDALTGTLTFSYNINQWFAGEGWEYSFEENEGFDSDHDFLGDYEEAQGKTKNASNMQDHDDPLRRQAMYFGGESNKSFLQTPVAKSETVPVDPASDEAHQLFLYYTVECWAKADEESLQNDGKLRTLVTRAIWADLSGPADEQLMRRNFLIGVKNGRWYTCYDGSTTDTNGTVEVANGPVATTEWTHVAATFDGKTLRLYVNGLCQDAKKDSSVQPEHGLRALALDKLGVMNPDGGSEFFSSSCITVMVGASPLTRYGIIYDYAWRYRNYTLVDEVENPQGLSHQTTYDDYGNFYKGYVDEVRIWDGARSAEEIRDDYENRTRYTTALAAANREEVYEQWRIGGRRADSARFQLPPQLMYHWAFDHIAGAVLTNDVIRVPAGFDTAKAVADAKARWVRPDDWVESCWANSAVKSTVYTDNTWVPWINNTVSHLPRFDLTTLDSVYWSEDYAGSDKAGFVLTNSSYTAFAFARSNEVYSRWTQQTYGDSDYYDSHYDRDFAIYNTQGAQNLTYSYTQKARWNTITGYGAEGRTNVTVVTDEVMKLRFAARDRNVVGDDILPMGGAYPRRISVSEGGMWDAWPGENPTASDAWAQTGTDADHNGLPDWWEEYARQNYGETLDPDEPLEWGTTVVRNGVEMPAYQAYLSDLVDGLVKIGDDIYFDKENYGDTRDNDRDGMPDWWEERYALDTAVNNADEDPDNDQLANIVEYLISNLSGFPTVKPNDMSTGYGQLVPDYFLRHGSLYLGEMFADHDMLEDWWEDEQETEIRHGGERFPNLSRYQYDADKDPDDDGWNNWEERRAEAFVGVSYELAYVQTNVTYRSFAGTKEEVAAEKAKLIAKFGSGAVTVVEGGGENDLYAKFAVYSYTDVSNAVPNYTGRPLPEVSCAIVYNGERGALAGQKIILKAWSQEDAYDPEMKGEPDATWILLANDTYPLNLTTNLAEATKGYLRSGKNMFVAYVAPASEASNKNSTETDDTIPAFVPGMPYGVVTDVDVRHLKAAPFTLELSDVSPTLIRFNLAEVLAAQGSYVEALSTIDFERAMDISSVDSENIDRTLYFQNLTNCYGAVVAKIDRGINERDYVGLTCADTFGTNTTFLSSNALVRVFLSEINDAPHKIGKDSQGNGYIHPYASDVPAFEGKFNIMSHPVITESDMRADGMLDLDWGIVTASYEADRDNSFADVESATYRVVVFDGPTDRMTNNNILVAAFVNRFERGDEPTPAQDLAVATYGGSPTFSWKHANSIGKPYPAFRLRVYEGRTMVYDSGDLPAPARDSKARYNFTAPIWPGMMTMAGVPFKADTDYTWEVSMLDAKFSDIDTFYDVATGSLRIPGSGSLSDYGKIAVSVKYMGPGTVVTNALVNLMRVEAYQTPDFSGQPYGVGYVKYLKDERGESSLAAADRIALNAVIEGLPKRKTYYLRAFLDSNGNGEREPWESWGYVNYVGTDRKDVYTPREVELTGYSLVPECVIYVEDADTNNNKLPDVWEWQKDRCLGGPSTVGVGAQSPYYVSISAKDAAKAKSLLGALGELGVTQVPYYASLAQLANGRSLSSVALALVVAGIDMANFEATPIVTIKSFSLSDGIAIDVDTAASVGGAPVTDTPVTIEVSLTLQLEYAETMASEWMPVGDPVTDTFTVTETETVRSDKINDAFKAIIEAKNGAGFFRVKASVNSRIAE